MKLTKRLKTIVDMVPKYEQVIDIGCDHALIDIYLTIYNKNKCIASDINEQALKQAYNNIEKYNLLDKIKIIKSNGFEYIDQVNGTAIIAGMGTKTILKILNCPKIKNLNTIIIQTNTEYDLFRKNLFKYNLKIIDEKIVNEKGIYYIISKLKPGKIKYTKKELFLGPSLLKSNDKNDYYKYLLEQSKKRYLCIPKKYFLKRLNIQKKIKWIKKELENI